MRGLKVSVHRTFFLTGFMLAFAGTGGIIHAQNTQPVDPTTTAGSSQTSTTIQTSQQTRTGDQDARNPDLTEQQVAKMDQYLDDHKDIQTALDKNPELINDRKFLNAHKGLEAFLDANPQLRAELAENPRYFMQRENRFETREDNDASRTASQTPRPVTNGQSATNGGTAANTNPNPNGQPVQSNRGGNPNPDLTRGEVANFDQFLDGHPTIDRQLNANPSLINDQRYLQANPALETYLTQHPQVREEISETPNYFLEREQRLEARESGQPSGGVRATGAPLPNAQTAPNQQADNDRDQQQVRLDQYLNDHKDVDRDLRKKPDLANDSGYLKKHRDLDEFFRANPDVRVLIVQNPHYFEDRDRDRARGVYLPANERVNDNGNASGQMRKQDTDRMDAFLDKHQKIAKDFHENPSLCNDDKYIAGHKDLREFYTHNPGMRQQLAQNRSYFDQRNQRLEHGAARGVTPNTDKKPETGSQTAPPSGPAPTNQPPSQQKAPVDQRQNMTPATTH